VTASIGEMNMDRSVYLVSQSGSRVGSGRRALAYGHAARIAADLNSAVIRSFRPDHQEVRGLLPVTALSTAAALIRARRRRPATAAAHFQAVSDPPYRVASTARNAPDYPG